MYPDCSYIHEMGMHLFNSDNINRVICEHKITSRTEGEIRITGR